MEANEINKRHVVTEVLICLAAIASVLTLLGPLILVPVAFMYPIVGGRWKLLLKLT
jgi:hypothetical protein